MKDTCLAKNGLCPSKNRFDRTTGPPPAGKLFEALKREFFNAKLD